MKTQFNGLTVFNRNSTKKGYPATLFGLASTTRIGEAATRFMGDNYDHYYAVLSSESPIYAENSHNTDLNNLESHGCLSAINKNTIEDMATVICLNHIHVQSATYGGSGRATLEVLGLAVERLLQQYCPIRSTILGCDDTPSYHFHRVFHDEYIVSWVNMLAGCLKQYAMASQPIGRTSDHIDMYVHRYIFSESLQYNENECLSLLNYYKDVASFEENFDTRKAESLQDAINIHLANILSLHKRVNTKYHWRHSTSGQKYRILGFAPYYDCPTEMCIIYKNIMNHEIYVRKANDFFRSMSYVKAKA